MPANQGSRRAAGSPGAIPLAARQREAWWQRIEELLDQAEELSTRGDAAEEAVDLWLHVADRHPDPVAQADCYRRVLSLRPGEPRALEALANLHARAEDWEQAARLLSKLADTVGSSARRAELEHRIGLIMWRELADDERAEAHLLHAFALRGAHMPTIRALVEIYRERSDWEGAAEILLRAEARTRRLSDRLELLLEAACLHREHLNARRAVALLEALLAIEPGHLPAIEELFDIHCAEEEWVQAEALIAGLERSRILWPEEMAELRVRLAVARVAAAEQPLDFGADEQEDDEELEIVIELEAGLPEDVALELADEEAELEEAELEEAELEEAELEEAELEDTPLGDSPTSPEIVIVYEEDDEVEESRPSSRSAQPEDDAMRDMVLELDDARSGHDFGLGPDDADEVLSRIHGRLQEDPRHAQSYRTLRGIFTARGDYDRAWCVCAVMTYLDCATPSERLYYETYEPGLVAQNGQALTRDLWERLVHPALDHRVGVVARAVGREIALAHARPHRHHGLNPRDRRDIRNDQLALSRALERAAALLDVPLPDLYLAPNETGGLSIENVVHRGRLSPALVARGNALRGRTPGELACIAGRAMAFLRPEFYLAAAFSTGAELSVIWEATLELARPAAKDGATPERSPSGARALLEKGLSSRARAELALAVNGSGLGFGSIDIAAWRRTVEITAQRIGLVLCGDPAIAARTLTERASTGAASIRKGEIDQLLLYAVSEDYFAVRRHLNGTIGAARRAARR